MYLVVECTLLDDQYECDCDRTPIRITQEYPHEYDDGNYEIYETNNEGMLVCIKGYSYAEDDDDDGWGFDDWGNEDSDYDDDRWELLDLIENANNKQPVFNDRAQYCPTPEHGVGVIVTANMTRDYYSPIDLSTTIAEVIDMSPIDPKAESVVLNGVPLRRHDGDFLKTFGEYGITDGSRCYLGVVKVSQNV